MVFNRVWDSETDGYIIDRTNTGVPPPPSTGTTTAEDGAIVSSSATVKIRPPTPVQVNLPGPSEPVIDSMGRMNPRWYRFLTELYTRTGGPIDNINRVPTTVLGAGTSDALVFTGVAPVAWITPIRLTGVGTLSLTGSIAEPALSSPVEAPQLGSLSVTGYAPEVV